MLRHKVPQRIAGLGRRLGIMPMKRGGLVFLIIGVLALVVVYGALFYPLYATRTYAPAVNDEAGYYLKARSVFVNRSLKGALIMEENTSRIGEAGLHGVMYPLLYAAIGGVIGFDQMTFLTANILFLSAAFGLLLCFRPFSLAQKLTVFLCVASYFVVFMYMFTYMVEVLQALFTVAASLLVLKIYIQRARSRRVLPWVIGLAACLLLFSLFRVSYLLFLGCLIPLADNRRQLAIFIVGFIVSFGGISLALRNFNALFPYGFMADLTPLLHAGRIGEAVSLVLDNLVLNLDLYFITETKGLFFYVAFKYWLVGVMVYFAAVGVRKGDRLALAAALLGVLYLASLFAFYSAGDWCEHRGLASLYYAYVIVLVFRKNRWGVAATLLLLAVSFPAVHHRVEHKIINERAAVARQIRRNGKMAEAYAGLGRHLQGEGGVITVLISRDLLAKHKCLPLALALKNRADRQIRYTYNRSGDPLERHLKIPVDYLLTDHAIEAQRRSLVLKNRWFHLYAVRE